MALPRWRYSWSVFTGDLFGGLVAALIAIPYGLAMATAMGLPPVLGLFTSILTAPITALLGRNPVLIGGTASATVPFVAVAVQAQGIGGAAKVCLVASVAMMAFSLLRLGRYIAKVPHAVVAGFSCGIGIMMVISQELGVLPLIVVATAFATARWAPRIPAPLAGIVAAVFAGAWLPGASRTVGALTLDLPDFAGFSWTSADVYHVLPSGLALAFVSSINVLVTSRVVEHFRGRHKPLKAADADRELGAYGIANVCAGMFGAPMSVGIPARTVASIRCGGSTRVANLVHAAAIVVCVGTGHELLSRIPVAALAGVIVYVGITLLEWSTWRRLHKMRRSDAAAFLLTAIAVVTVNAVAAVAIGCAVYGVRWAYLRSKSGGHDPLTAPANV